MSTFTWVGGSGDWTNSNDWLGGPVGAVPGSNDVAVINAGIVTIGTATVGELDVGSGAIVDVSTKLVAGTLDNSGSLILTTAAPSASLVFGGLTNEIIGLIAGGIINIGQSSFYTGSAGIFENAGTIDITSDGYDINGVGVLALANLSSLETIGTINGKYFYLGGTVENSGNTISVPSSTNIVLGGGAYINGATINGGTLSAIAYDGPGPFVAPTLDQTTLLGVEQINISATTDSPGILAWTSQLAIDEVTIEGSEASSAVVNIIGGTLYASGPGNVIDDAELSLGKSHLTGQSGTIDVTGQLSLGVNSSLYVSSGINNHIGGNGSVVEDGTISNSAGLIVNVAGFQNAGTIIANAGGSITLDPGSFSNMGRIEADGGSVDVAVSVTGSGTIALGNNGTVELGGSYDQQTFGFNGPGVLKLDIPDGSTNFIAGFTNSNTIDLPNISISSATLFSNGNMLNVFDGGASPIATFIMANDSSYVAGPDGGAGTQITVAQCFAAGTHILTQGGEVPVEDIRVGDLLPTVLGVGTAPVIWSGRRVVDCLRHSKPQKVWPVRVIAGAFGPARPHSDLWLSPDHAVYVNGVLIPVRHLINGSTIAQVPVDCVTYHHIELPQHDVLLAEGLPAESFLDMRDGSNFANRPDPIRLYPDYSARMWEALGCARLVVTGPELAAARALIARFTIDQTAA
jgi:hypothetical protein